MKSKSPGFRVFNDIFSRVGFRRSSTYWASNPLDEFNLAQSKVAPEKKYGTQKKFDEFEFSFHLNSLRGVTSRDNGGSIFADPTVGDFSPWRGSTPCNKRAHEARGSSSLEAARHGMGHMAHCSCISFSRNSKKRTVYFFLFRKIRRLEIILKTILSKEENIPRQLGRC